MPRSGQTPAEREYTHGRYYARGYHGPRSEWTPSDIAAITASDRPSDLELSPKLRHTILAIQVMRCKALKGSRSPS